MHIRVKTFTGLGRTYEIDVKPRMNVRELRRRVQEKTDMDDEVFNELSLCFQGTLLHNDNETLEYYDIQDNSLLQLINLNGEARDINSLGIKFVDLSNSNGLQKCQWSKVAPRWRVAARGLSLEGICTNSKCQAFNQQVVVPIGYKKYDILTSCADNEEDLCVCPICKQYVEAKTCGFNNCWWTFQGIKCEPGQRPERCPKEITWCQADDSYHYFNEKTGGIVNWRQLIVEARKEKPS